MKLRFFSRFGLPIVAGAVALTTLAGCDANVRIGYGRAYDRVWYGDPYCRYSWDYGCNYGYNDGARIRFVFGRRHPGWRWGGWGVMASDASRPTTWEREFNLNARAVKFLKTAFNNALEGKVQQLHAVGLSYEDINGLREFRMPSERSLANAAHELGVRRTDLRDFVQVFMIRMKAAAASMN